MSLRTAALTSVVLLPIAAFACGGSAEPAPAPTPAPTTTSPAPTAPTPETPPVKADDPVDPNYPSPHTPLPTLDYNGGPILESASIVTVTFPGDDKRVELEEFGDTITQTPWWDAVSEGYCGQGKCVGRGKSGGHVALTEAAAKSYTDSSQGSASSIQDFIRRLVADGTLPAPDGKNTLYAFYFPVGTSIDLDGSQSCREFGAYHNSTDVTPPGGALTRVAYAIMPRCGTNFNQLTISASHEFTEAATDPYVGHNDIAYYMRNQLWSMFGGENADLCVNSGFGGAHKEGKWVVQRSWSNKSAQASHDPCVPIPDGAAYFNVAPDKNFEQIKLAQGESMDITLKAFSDAPIGDWTIDAVEGNTFMGGSSYLSFKLDKETVHNGSKVTLTVTADKKIPQYALYVITSQKGSTRHSWPLVVTPKK